MFTELELICMLVLSCLVAVYEETAGLTVRDPVLRTHKVNNAKLYCFLLGLQCTVLFLF
jgi:vacuolar-type H+-ATPase catalytic subunit A/Vma1